MKITALILGFICFCTFAFNLAILANSSVAICSGGSCQGSTFDPSNLVIAGLFFGMGAWLWHFASTKA